jgi:hypothetical protein
VSDVLDFSKDVYNFILDPFAIWGGGKGQSVGGHTTNVTAITSKEGVPRPIVWGIARPLGGNIIASGDPLIIYQKKSN